MSRIEDIPAYPFTMSEEKGRKAAVRFRENLRKYYNDLGLTDGLMMKDQPILQLFCYDPKTEIAFCRIWSTKHAGPIFPNVTELYNTYNLSQQGHPKDVFMYAGTDEDRGKELGVFLETIPILTAADFEPEQRALFEQAVESNPLLLRRDQALQEKKSHKPATTTKKPSPKKRPGRPKGGTTKRPSSKKRAKADPPSVPEATPAPTTTPAVTSAPGATASVSDLKIGNSLDDVSATITYRREGVQYSQLPAGSLERAALNWSLFTALLAENPDLAGEPAIGDGEEYLRQVLFGRVPDTITEEPEKIDIDQVLSDAELGAALDEELAELNK